MNASVYGKNSDGTLSICRSKPENYGKGRCFHGEHIEFSLKEIRDGAIDKHNEEVYATQNAIDEKSAFDALPEIDNNLIKNSTDSKSITKKELVESAHNVADAISTDDFRFLQKFAKDSQDALRDSRRTRIFQDNVDNVYNLLQSNTKSAVRLREFLGKDINLRDLSEIMVQEIRSMTSAERFNKTCSSPSRVVMSSFDNDMTKQKYIASILYFGGRCCYCNKVLHKGPPSKKGASRQATGEHITPINAASGSIGSTRFGNMALACKDCNGSRGNKELTTWLSGKAKPFSAEHAVKSLGRIQAFRRFAFYEDYSPEKSEKIKGTLKNFTAFINDKREPSGAITEENFDKIKEEYKKVLYYLKFNEQNNES